MPRPIITTPRPLITAPKSVVGGNLLRNGSFEIVPSGTIATTAGKRWINGTALGSTTDDTYGWGTGVMTGNCNAAFDNTIAFIGSYSMRLSTLAAAASATVYNIGIYDSLSMMKSYATQLAVGDFIGFYNLSYRMKTSLISGSANTGATAGVTLFTGNGTVAGSSFNASIATTTDWTYYNYRFQLLNGATRFIEVTFKLNGADGAGTLIMDAYFDDIQLKPERLTTRSFL